MKPDPTAAIDPSALVLSIARFAEATVRYSEHAAEIEARRGRGEVSLVFSYDLTARRIAVHAVSRDGKRAPVLTLGFRDKRGWMAE